MNEFVIKFQTEGPGTVEQDMDRGQKLMEIYAQEFEKLDAIRLEMGEIDFPFSHFNFSLWGNFAKNDLTVGLNILLISYCPIHFQFNMSVKIEYLFLDTFSKCGETV